MEVGTTKISRFKSIKFWLKTAGVLIVVSMFYSLGVSTAKVDLGKEKVTYDELIETTYNKKQTLEDIKEDLNDISKQYSDKKIEFDDAMKVISNKKTIEDEIVKLNETFKSKQDESSKLDSDIKAKKDELAALTGQVQEKKDAPKVLSAGKFTVGKDIPAGRYKAVPNRGSGNFFVNGGADVNTMLGKGDFYEPEYIFEVVDGDEIEITFSVKFIPIK